jgi:hypothetical protein
MVVEKPAAHAKPKYVLDNFKTESCNRPMVDYVFQTKECRGGVKALWYISLVLTVLYAYLQDLSGCHVETRVLGELLEKKLPR